MHRYAVGGARSKEVGPDLVDQVYRLRHRVFKEKLNWEVQSVAGREVDEFDDANAVYVIAQRPGDGEVDASWRIRPTTLPYMLRDTFPQLLGGHEPPNDPSVWEVSRFAAAHDVYAEGVAGFSEIAQDIVAHTVMFAIENNIRSYVWVTSVGVERMALKLGYRLRRFGPSMRIGDVRCVANQVEMDDAAIEIASRRLGKKGLRRAA